MLLDQLVNSAKDAMTVKRVYGEPIEKDGVTVIPAAAVSAGGGGGSGQDKDGGAGDGGGFAARGRPVGAFVIRGESVRWQPAVDTTRVVTMVGSVLIAWLFTRRRRRGRSS